MNMLFLWYKEHFRSTIINTSGQPRPVWRNFGDKLREKLILLSVLEHSKELKRLF